MVLIYRNVTQKLAFRFMGACGRRSPLSGPRIEISLVREAERAASENRYSKDEGLTPHDPLGGMRRGARAMHSIIYLVGLIVVVMFILSALGLR
jgi:hypothetical protein